MVEGSGTAAAEAEAGAGVVGAIVVRKILKSIKPIVPSPSQSPLAQSGPTGGAALRKRLKSTKPTVVSRSASPYVVPKPVGPNGFVTSVVISIRLTTPSRSTSAPSVGALPNSEAMKLRSSASQT